MKKIIIIVFFFLGLYLSFETFFLVDKKKEDSPPSSKNEVLKTDESKNVLSSNNIKGYDKPSPEVKKSLKQQSKNYENRTKTKKEKLLEREKKQ